MTYSSVIRAARCAMVWVVALFWAVPAFAQQRLAAEKLFSEAAALMDAGEFAEACPKLEESQRLDPAGGTVLLLAHCYEGMGRTASAWQQFKSAISWARRDGRPEREELAAEHARELEAKLSRVAIDVPPEVEETIRGLRVEVDGAEFGKALWGTPVPLDPGEHVILATAPDRKESEQRIELGAAQDLKVVTIPALEPAEGVATLETQGSEQPIADTARDQATEEPDDGSTQRLVSYVVGGVGVVSLGVGTVFGFQALSKRSEAEDKCPTSPCTDEAGVAANDDAKTYANVANVGVGLGIVALGAAAYLYLTAPEAPPEAATLGPVRVDPLLGPEGGGVLVGGTF